jgi:4-amino-4-deoxy-L-arabinose transferase-like glycosyltransferase
MLGVAVAACFLALMLWTTEGHFVAQISDLYVVAQYAKAMAEGHPFQYNAGEAPTTGATSLLHTACLALAHATGARGEGLIAFAVLFGAALFVASIPLAVRVGRRLASPREGVLAGALLALSGPVVWAYLYGSDIALFLFLALLVLDRWLELWRGGGSLGFAVAGVLLALARPEGLVVALVLGAASQMRPGPVASRRERLSPWIPAAAGFLVLVLQRALVGSWLGTSVAEKSLLPNYGPVETIAVASKYGVDVLRGLFLGFYPSEAPIGFSQGMAAFAFPPLGLLLVLLAAVRTKIDARAPARVWLALVFFLFALVGPNVFMGVHFNRYLLWAFPGLLAFVAAGLSVLTRIAARDDEALERGLFRAGAALMLTLGFLSTARFAAAYAEMAGETWRREIPMAEYIRTHLPKGVPIANAATSIEYLTGHRNMNLHGVTSPAFVGNRTAEREAGLFESLVRLPEAERPPWLLLTRSGYEGSELMRAFTDGSPVFETASFGDDLLLFHARWDLLDLGAEPVLPDAVGATAGLAETDRVNVCDTRDEQVHAYRYDSRQGELLLAGSVTLGEVPGHGRKRMLADAGRVILGGESFRVKTRPGRDLVVVLRTNRTVVARTLRAQGGLAVPVELAEAGIVVRAGGRVAARLELPNLPGWNEHVFRIPAESITGQTTELQLSGRYAAFHYWFYQQATIP